MYIYKLLFIDKILAKYKIKIVISVRYQGYCTTNTKFVKDLTKYLGMHSRKARKEPHQVFILYHDFVKIVKNKGGYALGGVFAAVCENDYKKEEMTTWR